jgi:hypothetical protein
MGLTIGQTYFISILLRPKHGTLIIMHHHPGLVIVDSVPLHPTKEHSLASRLRFEVLFATVTVFCEARRLF